MKSRWRVSHDVIGPDWALLTSPQHLSKPDVGWDWISWFKSVNNYWIYFWNVLDLCLVISSVFWSRLMEILRFEDARLWAIIIDVKRLGSFYHKMKFIKVSLKARNLVIFAVLDDCPSYKLCTHTHTHTFSNKLQKSNLPSVKWLLPWPVPCYVVIEVPTTPHPPQLLPLLAIQSLSALMSSLNS